VVIVLNTLFPFCIHNNIATLQNWYFQLSDPKQFLMLSYSFTKRQISRKVWFSVGKRSIYTFNREI